ncbi:MAG: D-2-hydroxyacid dehydrogenase [Longimicrobiales bacterium]|nr:D-2-hydroxyacid dehydrogenase [Longimicrobiales bacterium]
MSTGPVFRRQLVTLTIVFGVYASILACSGGEAPPPEPSAPLTGSYEDFTSEELVQAFDLRESDVPVRDLPGWAPPKKVVVVVPEEWDRREERMAFLQAVAPGVELIPVRNRGDAVDRGVLVDAQAVLGLGCAESTVSAIGPEVRWIQSGSVGVEGCFTSGTPPGETNRILRERNIVTTSIRGMTARAIAQHSLTIMLSLIGGMDIHNERQGSHIWGRTQTDIVKDKNLDKEFQDQTLFVVGLGSIGTEVARLAHALGMRVVATRATSRSGPAFVDYVGLSDEMYELAGQADVVFASVPNTPDTQDMFNARFFDAMKETAYFVSIVRLPVVNWDDLKEALRSGSIAGFGADDLPQDDFELWDMPRVIMTPHVSDYSNRYRDNQFLLYRENLRRYVAGDKMLNVVDLQRGY